MSTDNKNKHHSSKDHPAAPSTSRARVDTRGKATAQKKFVLAAVLVFSAFFVSYVFAAAQPSASAKTVADDSGNIITGAETAGTGDGGAAGGAGGCACCGGAGGGAQVEGTTKVAGGVQTIKVDTSQGSFNPNRIVAKAGIPIEIEFSQSPGGCLSSVLFGDFGIEQDLTAGPATVKIPAQKAGEYQFSCQMQMVFGTLVVK